MQIEKEIFYQSFYNRAWLLSNEFFHEMCAVLSSTYLKDFEVFKKERDYDTNLATVFEDVSVAILEINGVIEQKESFWSWLFGGVSTETIKNDIRTLIKKGIKTLVLDINSPGGSVDGIIELSNFIYSSRKNIKIYAVVNPLAASAAYWLASATHKIYLASETALIGSVGVLTIHTDISKRNENEGIKITEITSTKRKVDGSPYSPLPPEGKKDLQEEVNYIHNIFIDHLARNLKIDRVGAEKLGDGRIYFGQTAIDKGFAQEIKTLDDLLTELGEKEMNEKEKKTEKNLFEKVTAESLKEKQFDVYDEIFNAGISQGVTSEKKREEEISSFVVKGFETLANEAKKEGWTCEKFVFEQTKKIKEQGITKPQMEQDNEFVDFQGKTEIIDEQQERKRLAEKVLEGMKEKN